jgi:hypothetical protein
MVVWDSSHGEWPHHDEWHIEHDEHDEHEEHEERSMSDE